MTLAERSRTLPRTSPAWGLFAAGVATQVAYPLTTGATRDRVSVAVVVLLAAGCVAHAAAVRGGRWASGMVAVTVGVGLGAELVGTLSGVPFGCYAYAPGRLGPALAGVPVVIGAAWTMGAYPAWCAAERVTGGAPLPRLLLAAWGLASWDLYLDPQMVADGRWRFCGTGPVLPGLPGLPELPQVPLSNFSGWLLVSLVVAVGLSVLRAPERAATNRSDTAVLVLLLWTWLGSALAHLCFLGLPVSGVYGFLAMGVLGGPLAVSLHRDRR